MRLLSDCEIGNPGLDTTTVQALSYPFVSSGGWEFLQATVDGSFSEKLAFPSPSSRIANSYVVASIG